MLLNRAGACALGIAAVLVFAPVAQAEVISVDPGQKISVGKKITGSGQNLPSIDAAVPWNIGTGPASQVISYYTSGEVARDQGYVASAARKWTRQWIKRECGSTKPARVRDCKAAAVFDIDDTLKSSFPLLSSATPSFSYDQAASRVAIASCSKPVIEAIELLYHDLSKMGVAIFLVTGRPATQRDETIACLKSAGLIGWKELILRPAGNKGSAALYKSLTRKGIEKNGWKIGPSIGDQMSDMSYGHLKHGFLVPNPMYYLP